VQPLWKSVWNYLKKLKISLPYNFAIPLWGIYSKESKLICKRNTCIPIFFTVLFTTFKLQKQLRCSTTNEWIMKYINIYIYLYNILLSHKEKLGHLQENGQNLEIIMFSDTSQAQKAKNLSFVWKPFLKLWWQRW
jgi:hypothetical protein